MTGQNTASLSQAVSRRVEAPPASRPDSGLAGFEHRFATIEGTRLHYVTGGSADGDAVVLLAGFPESWFAWRKVIPLLAGSYKVYAVDLPGQGDSDRPGDGYDTRSLATKLHGLMVHLEVGRHFLAAHDVGAWVAYPYAAMFGDDVRRLAESQMNSLLRL